MSKKIGRLRDSGSSYIMRNLFGRKRKSSLSKIEDILFRGQDRSHAVIYFASLDNYIVIELAPWIESGEEMLPDSRAVVEARFNNARISSKEIYGETSDDMKFPWDIIGFDSEPLLDNKWSFCLHTDRIEYIFESDWLEIKFK